MMILLAIIFPTISFLLRGEFLYALIAFILQMTVIGWLPVAIWAAISVHDSRREYRLERMENHNYGLSV